MELNEVKELVNFKTIGADAVENGLEGFFEEDVEVLVDELENKVWKFRRESKFDESIENYLDFLKKEIRRRLLNCIVELRNEEL